MVGFTETSLDPKAVGGPPLGGLPTHPLDIARTLAVSGRPDESEAILLELAAQGDPRAKFNLGWHHCRHGRLCEGIEHLTIGRTLNVFGSPPVNTDKPIWRDESLVDKHLLYRCEGGFGDQIANLRFARQFKERGARVILSCERGLFPLFRSVEYVDGLISNEGPEHAFHDYWVPAMSAAFVLGIDYNSLSGAPYLPKPKSLNLPGTFKVGLRWAGNPAFEDEQLRRFPPELMLDLSRNSSATFYSLQIGHGSCPLPDTITDLGPFLRTWQDTAQVIAGLDLVISSCTAVAHLAAAMGVPTWVVVPILPYYLWAQPGHKSAWYDSVRVYRQKKFGEWEAPFKKIHTDLAAVVTASKRGRS